jgi:hypothetical protein
MVEEYEKLILERIDAPGWVTTRGILLDPTGEGAEEDHRQVETAMKNLAEKGRVTLWTLILQDNAGELLTAARPGLELDRDLEQRGAWATAVRYNPES